MTGCRLRELACTILTIVRSQAYFLTTPSAFDVCSRSNSNRRVWAYVAVVSGISSVLSVTKFFEYTRYKPTDMYENRAYQIYNFFIRGLFILGIIPFVTLIGLYAMIYRDIRRHEKEMGGLCGGKAKALEEGKKERRLAVIFAGFVLTFLICHTPRLLFDSYLLINGKWFLECLAEVGNTLPYPIWLKPFEPVKDLFITLNSATNIVVYTCMSEQFRKECRKLIKRIPCCTSDSPHPRPTVATTKSPATSITMLELSQMT